MKDLGVTMQSTMQEVFLPAGDIPDIDLYVDQIITLLEGRLGGTRRTADEKIITKTMINNYSKDGLLKRIKGKKYSKQHVMMVLLICGLKRGMAVQDIARVLSGLDERLEGENGGYEPGLAGELYDLWGRVEANTTATLPGYVLEQLDGLAGGKDDPLPAIMLLTEIAALCRRTAEALIDESFPEKQK